MFLSHSTVKCIFFSRTFLFANIFQYIVITIDYRVDHNDHQSAAIGINTLSGRVRWKTFTIAACLNHNETGHVNYMTAMSYFKVTCVK